MKDILVFSVIIPVYNAERWINRTIDAILAQTYPHFELLLVDDGSKDDSLKVCEKYASQDNRIKVFHKPNGGVSSARNLGLIHATGDYVVFIDADDWVDVDYLQCLLPLDEEDMMACSFMLDQQDKSVSADWSVPLTDTPSCDTLLALTSNLTNFAFCSVCCKSFRNSVIRQAKLRFDESITQCEDGLFVYDYLCAKPCKVCTQSKVAYHYRWDYKERGSYQCFPMEQSYLLMDKMSDRLERLESTYGSAKEWKYIQQEMLSSHVYNVFRTILSKPVSRFAKFRQLLTLIHNRHVRGLLTDRQFMQGRRRGKLLCRIMRVYYCFF